MDLNVAINATDSLQALRQSQAQCSRLQQRITDVETQLQEIQNDKKFNSTGKKDKRKPNALRHYAQGFTFTTNFWTIETASTLVATVIPADFDPSTRHTLVPATPEHARKHDLYCFLWELDEYLPDEQKQVMRNVADMKKAHPSFIITQSELNY